MELGTIFKENEYADAYQYAEACGYLIEAIDNEHFKIVERPVIVQPEPTEEELKQARISELQQYLSETDWYAIRESETGIDIPAEVKKARADARAEISYLRGDEETLEPIEKNEELPVVEEEVVPQIENTIEEID